MKTVTQEIKVYTYSELNETVKDKVKENFSDVEFHTQETINDWKEKLETLGYDSPEIHYSGFSSQGDGACFDANPDTNRLVERWEEETKSQFNHQALRHLFIEQVSGKIYKTYYSNHYNHEKTRFFSSEVNYTRYGRINKMLDEKSEEFDKWVEADRLDICGQIYKALEDEYNYSQSDEAITELCAINDWEFLENGEMYHEPPKHEPTLGEVNEIIRIQTFQHDIRAVVTNCCFQSASHGGQRYAGDFMIDAETLMNEDSKGLYVWSLTEMGSHLTKVDPESEIKSTFRYNSGKKVVILKLVDMTNHTIRDTTEDEITKLFDALKTNKEEVK